MPTAPENGLLLFEIFQVSHPDLPPASYCVFESYLAQVIIKASNWKIPPENVASYNGFVTSRG